MGSAPVTLDCNEDVPALPVIRWSVLFAVTVESTEILNENGSK